MKLKLNPTPADELDVLRNLREEIDTLLVLTDSDERFQREHGPSLRRMHTLVIAAKAYQKAQR